MGGISITDTHMSSPDTPHTARVKGEGWEVSWLPGRTLNRNQAITAMTIASIVGGKGVPRADDPIWMHFDCWAAELSLTAPSAVMRACEPPLPHGPDTPQADTAGPFGSSRLCAHANRDGKNAH